MAALGGPPRFPRAFLAGALRRALPSAQRLSANNPAGKSNILAGGTCARPGNAHLYAGDGCLKGQGNEFLS